jgi:predicted porin
MKKSLFALAAAGAFVGAAQAQSSVTVYGVLDASYSAMESVSTTTGGVKTTANLRNTVNGDGALSTSRLGFRGVEDLGGGKSAQFVLEYDLVNIGTGATGNPGTPNQTTVGQGTNTSNGFGPRYSYIGLSDKAMGTLRLGRQETAIHGSVANNLAGMANNTLGSLYSGLDSTNQLSATETPGVRPHTVFIDNAVTYISPNIGGVTVQLQTAQNAYNSGVTGSTTRGAQTSGGSITFTGVKGLRLDAAMIVEGVVNQTSTAGGGTTNLKKTTKAVGGNYDFGPAIVFALHTQNKFENLSAASAGMLSDTKLTEVGVRAPVTKVVTAWANYFTGSRSTDSATATQMAQSSSAAVGAADISGFQLGAMYALSKRTAAYGIYGSQEIKGTKTASGAKLEGSMYAIGLRHTF